MRVLVQRVSHAKVVVEGETIGEIGSPDAYRPMGLLLLVGIGAEDESAVAELMPAMAQKVVNLRIFPDEQDKMNLSLSDVRGEILAVSQFTLYADCRKGRRPSFIGAAAPQVGSKLFDAFVESLRALGVRVATGRFGAMMDVHLVNDGPVTIWLDSAELLA